MDLQNGKGLSVVATSPILSGATVCEYGGELISAKEGRRREKIYGDTARCYMYFFLFDGKQYCLDATEDDGGVGRMINHAKPPKANLSPVCTLSASGKPTILFKASQNIAVGAELSYPYGEKRREVLDANPWLK